MLETKSTSTASAANAIYGRIMASCRRLQRRRCEAVQSKVEVARHLFDQAVAQHVAAERTPIVVSSYRRLQWSALAAGCFEQLLSETTFRRSVRKDTRCLLARATRKARVLGQPEIVRFLDAAIEQLPGGSMRIRNEFRWPPANCAIPIPSEPSS